MSYLWKTPSGNQALITIIAIPGVGVTATIQWRDSPPTDEDNSALQAVVVELLKKETGLPFKVDGQSSFDSREAMEKAMRSHYGGGKG